MGSRGRRSSKNTSEPVIVSEDSESDCTHTKDGSKSEGKDGAISLLQSLAEEVSENIKKDEKKKSRPDKSEKKDSKSSRSDSTKSRKPDEKHKDKSRNHHSHSSSHEKDRKK